MLSCVAEVGASAGGTPGLQAGTGAAACLGELAELTHAQRAWAERAQMALRHAGHRRGGARDLLIALFARERCALTAQEIAERLRGWLAEGAVGRPVAIASVYRGIEVLQELGLIVRVDLGDGVA